MIGVNVFKVRLLDGATAFIGWGIRISATASTTCELRASPWWRTPASHGEAVGDDHCAKRFASKE